jgi:hypothetical protein
MYFHRKLVGEKYLDIKYLYSRQAISTKFSANNQNAYEETVSNLRSHIS